MGSAAEPSDTEDTPEDYVKDFTIRAYCARIDMSVPKRVWGHVRDHALV
jgi:hypothetical protein